MTQADDVTSQNLSLAALVCIVLGAASMAKPDADLAATNPQPADVQQLVEREATRGGAAGQ